LKSGWAWLAVILAPIRWSGTDQTAPADRNLTSLVLAQARVIEYRSTLSSSRRESFERNRVSLMEGVAFAAGRLKAALKRK
jgi:hypothetical protein